MVIKREKNEQFFYYYINMIYALCTKKIIIKVVTDSFFYWFLLIFYWFFHFSSQNHIIKHSIRTIISCDLNHSFFLVFLLIFIDFCPTCPSDPHGTIKKFMQWYLKNIFCDSKHNGNNWKIQGFLQILSRPFVFWTFLFLSFFQNLADFFAKISGIL